MGNPLFGINISGIIKQAMAKGLLPLVLVKEIPGARDAADLTDGQALAEKRYPCRGFIDSYALRQIDGTTVQRGDKKILIIGDTLPAGVIPEPNDRIVAEGITHVIQGTPERDPAIATYVCQGRG